MFFNFSLYCSLHTICSVKSVFFFVWIIQCRLLFRFECGIFSMNSCLYSSFNGRGGVSVTISFSLYYFLVSLASSIMCNNKVDVQYNVIWSYIMNYVNSLPTNFDSARVGKVNIVGCLLERSQKMVNVMCEWILGAEKDDLDSSAKKSKHTEKLKTIIVSL